MFLAISSKSFYCVTMKFGLQAYQRNFQGYASYGPWGAISSGPFLSCEVPKWVKIEVFSNFVKNSFHWSHMKFVLSSLDYFYK